MRLSAAGQCQGSGAEHLPGHLECGASVTEAGQGQCRALGHAPAAAVGIGDRGAVTELWLERLQLPGIENQQRQGVTCGELLQAWLIGFAGDAGNAVKR